MLETASFTIGATVSTVVEGVLDGDVRLFINLSKIFGVVVVVVSGVEVGTFVRVEVGIVIRVEEGVEVETVSTGTGFDVTGFGDVVGGGTKTGNCSAGGVVV